MLTALWKVLWMTLKALFVLARLAVVKCTFMTWVAGMWLYAQSPHLQALVTSNPALVLVAAALSVAIGIRWLSWMTRWSSATHQSYHGESVRSYR